VIIVSVGTFLPHLGVIELLSAVPFAIVGLRCRARAVIAAAVAAGFVAFLAAGAFATVVIAGCAVLGGPCGIIRRRGRGSGAVALLATLASAQVTLYDTGPHAVCTFNGAATNLGWTSGNVSPAQPQRWAAQPFTLPAGNWHITQIAPEWFTGTGVNTSLGFTIWHRVGQVAPAVADEAVSGGAPVVLDNDPITTDFVLAGGDYYLSVYSSSAQGNTIGWFTNAQNGIHFIDPVTLVPFMYRGVTYPPPSWVFYELAPAVLAPANGSDPNKLYCAAFKIVGEQAPVVYCSAGTSEAPSSCVPTIGSIGYPHVSQPLGFTVQVTNMPVGRSGIIFYSILGRASVQWGAGSSTFCMLAR